MAGRASRTYKLQLSDEGIGFFIDCHRRLARAVRDLIPYGMTLYVAMALFARLDASEQSADLGSPQCARLAGRTVHFVGFSYELRSLITRILSELARSGQVPEPPKVSRLYVAGMMALAGAEEPELLRAYRQACIVLATPEIR